MLGNFFFLSTSEGKKNVVLSGRQIFIDEQIRGLGLLAGSNEVVLAFSTT